MEIDRVADPGLLVLTWNVWFGNLGAKQRFQAILGDLLTREPDVACFQEVTDGFVETIRYMGVEGLYVVSPNYISSYGCLTLVKRELLPQFHEVRLPTQMGRTLILATFGGVAIGNVHLESRDNEETRRNQLRTCEEALRPHSTAILCGDFNFDATKTWGDWRKGAKPRPCEELEHHVLAAELPDWIDTWPALMGEEDHGYTFDGTNNPACVRDPQEQMRYDHIMIKPSGSLEPLNICMVGTTPIDPTLVETLDRSAKLELADRVHMLKPSDHYGVLVTLGIKCGGDRNPNPNPNLHGAVPETHGVSRT